MTTSTTAGGANVPEVRIRATSGWVPVNLGELWDYREVVYMLAWRDVKARYKQTIFGAAWAVFQPLLSMVIFSLVFGRLAKMPSDGIPYPIFSFAALVPWTYFANTVTKASNSLVGGGALVNRIYFPRLSLPLSSVCGNLLDFGIAFFVLLGLMWYYDVAPTSNVIWLPALMLLSVCTAFGVSMVLSAVNVQFRDVQHAVPFLVQAWMYATPIVYPASLISDPAVRALYSLNPMVGVVEGFRWALLGTNTAPGLSILISVAVAVTLVVFGGYYFKRMERTFADLI